MGQRARLGDRRGRAAAALGVVLGVGPQLQRHRHRLALARAAGARRRRCRRLRSWPPASGRRRARQRSPGADRRPEGTGQRVGGELGGVELGRAEAPELGGDLLRADAGRVEHGRAADEGHGSAAGGVAAPQPLAMKPASVTRSPLTLTENVISSQHAAPPAVTVKASSGVWPWPWGEVRWCSKASAVHRRPHLSRSPSSRSWTGVHRRRRPGQRIGAAGRLGEGDHLADVVAAGEQRDDPVEPEGDPAVRRGTVAQRVEQEAEPRLRLLLVDPDQLEDALLDVGAVVTDRPAADLVAVEDEVVGAREQRPGIVEVGRRGGLAGGGSGSGEGMVLGDPSAAPRRSRRTSGTGPPRGSSWRPARHQSKRRASSSRSAPRTVAAVAGLRRRRSAAGRRARPRARPLTAAISSALRNLAIGERQAGSAPSLLHERPHQPLGAVLLGQLGQGVELGARQLAGAGVDAA